MKNRLFSVASQLRKFLENNTNHVADAGYDVFKGFPTGCCEYSTHLLSHYLVHHKVCDESEIQMPWNNYDRDDEWTVSHGWVRLNNVWNIDITADQFSGVDTAVIVDKDNDFHDRFIGGEWVGFEEHHRRATCHDKGESFARVWDLISQFA